MNAKKIVLFCLLGLLYLLHNDRWNWNDGHLVLGLPVGLVYHIGFCLVTIALLSALVRWAWPFEDGDEVDS